jgi:hypothetical protein
MMGLCVLELQRGGVYVNIKKVAAVWAQESCMWPRSAAIHCAACRVYCSRLNHPFGFIKRTKEKCFGTDTQLYFCFC